MYTVSLFKSNHSLQRTIRFIICGAIVLLCSDCDRLRAGNHSHSSFEYREIYLAESMGYRAHDLGLNNVDNDWPIWGHNLQMVLPERPMKTIYAKVNGNTIQNQFCFMSETLYDYIEEYIHDNYNGGGRRFAILPNDNSTVCLCSKCRAQGNTEGNASPAVIYMIRRLAQRFPQHTFFTSHYLTTRSLPDKPLPSNAGVLISAINYPLTVSSTPEEQKFERIIEAWKQCTDKVYIWDYINNFDDYFTPFPIFSVMQRRLQLYTRHGVNGVFLNGSGPDYSAFSHLKIHVLVSLLDNPNTDWRTVLNAFCRISYPVTGQAIERFLLAQEDYVVQTGMSLPLYEGVTKALESYLPLQPFLDFYDELQQLRPKTVEQERTETELLCAALEMPALGWKRMNADTTGTAAMLARLDGMRKQGVTAYNESGWTVESYVRDYTFMLTHAKETSDNLLKGVSLIPLTPLDPDYSDPSILTDGMLGLPSNYHCGNMLSSAALLRIAVPQVKGMRRLRVCLTRNKPYHILFPQLVTLSLGGKEVASVVPKKLVEQPGHSFVEFTLPPASGDSQWVLTFERNPDERTMAIDEIEGF